MTNKPNLLKNIKISIAKNNGISKYLHLWNLTKTNNMEVHSSHETTT